MSLKVTGAVIAVLGFALLGLGYLYKVELQHSATLTAANKTLAENLESVNETLESERLAALTISDITSQANADQLKVLRSLSVQNRNEDGDISTADALDWLCRNKLGNPAACGP